MLDTLIELSEEQAVRIYIFHLMPFFILEERQVEIHGGLHRGPPAFMGQVLQRCHVVEPIGHLDEQQVGEAGVLPGDPGKVFPLMVRCAHVLRPGFTRERSNGIGRVLSEGRTDLLRAHLPLFEGVMQQGGNVGGVGQPGACREQDLQDGEGVADERAAIRTLLPRMRAAGEVYGVPEGEEVPHSECGCRFLRQRFRGDERVQVAGDEGESPGPLVSEGNQR